MGFFAKTKGAVSIFLVLILVPMLTVSGLFVDASKLKLAKGVAASAGDLTLNTALTDYDTKLKELYGLIATAQDTSDLYAKLENYYRTCITSAGVSPEDSEIYAERMLAQLGVVSESGDVSDIMNMELIDFSASKYPNGNLANATILKKQIVDFMKYRAPINTGLSFLSSLKSFSTLSKQSELVEKKQAYYEAQQTVMQDLQSAWSEIADYNKNSVVTDSNYLTNIKSTLNGYETDYKDYGKRTIKSLYNKYDKVKNYTYSITITEVEQQLYDVKDGKLDQKKTTYNITYGGVTNYSYLSSNYNKVYKFSSKKFPKLSDVKSALEGYNNALYNLDIKAAPTYNAGSDYNIQFIAQKKLEMEQYTSKAVNYHIAYQKLKNVLLWLDGYDKEGVEIKDENGNKITKQSILDQSVTINRKTKTVQQWINEWNIDGIYNDRMEDLIRNSSTYKSCANQASQEYDDQYQITPTKSIDTALSERAAVANDYVETIQSAIDNLSNAITYLNSAKTKLTSNVANAKQEWTGVANDSTIKDTSLAKQDKAEIDQLDTYLNETNINKLVTRLTNIKTDLEAVQGQVKEYKYADYFIGDLGSYSSLETAFGEKWDNLNSLSINKTEITNEATTMANSVWSSGNVQTDWIKQSGHQPSLLQDKTALYTYLSSHFANTTNDTKTDSSASPESSKKEADPTNGEDLYGNIKNSSETSANSATSGTDSGQAGSEESKKHNINELANIPSKLDTSVSAKETPASESMNTKIDADESGKGAAGKSASALSGLFGGDFLSIVSEMGEKLRDKLFISDYIMSMFSYDTIEKEHSVKGEEGPIQSLTKNDISEANNYAYGAEIEYILYGGGNAGNIAKAYASIYAIRFGFNLVYAFATSEIRESALAMATPISAATMGIIPVPLIQAVIIIGIACVESGLDLMDLREGKEVVLYKSSDTWRCSISGLMKMAKGVVANELKNVAKSVTETAFSKGVDELNKVLDMTDEEISKLTDKELQDLLSDVATATGNVYDQVITENINSVVQQLTTLVNTAVESTYCLEGKETIEDKKEEMKLWVKTQLESWSAQFPGDDLASTAKREAVNYIVQNSGTMIDELFDKVFEVAKISKPGEAIDSAINGDTQISGQVDKLGGEIMNKVTAIRQSITNKITGIGTKVSEYKDKMIDEVRTSVNKGAESLKDTINSKIDGMFGTSSFSGDGGKGSGTDGNTALASMFSFSYSDYLRLFVLIGLVANEEKIILRTGDVIQANMIHVGEAGFELQNSAAYVQISATVMVKPTFLALPLLADVENNPVGDSGWYTFTYGGIAGY